MDLRTNYADLTIVFWNVNRDGEFYGDEEEKHIGRISAGHPLETFVLFQWQCRSGKRWSDKIVANRGRREYHASLPMRLDVSDSRMTREGLM